MAKIAVAGLINVETTLKIDGFPIDYTPVRYPFFGVRSTVSGVGYNVTKALKILGHELDFLSLVGTDYSGDIVRAELGHINVSAKRVLSQLSETPQSVILYDGLGKRMINTDLKNIQESAYPLALFQPEQLDLAVLCNINFSRPMLQKARQAGIPIATDVHVIRSLDDDYNRDYMAAANILFMSDESLPTSPETWIRQIWERFSTPIVGIGLGNKGAILGVKADEKIVHFPAKQLRPIVNTVGAGDALFSSFVHGYLENKDPYLAMEKAILFAAHKIGEKGAAEGFLNVRELEILYRQEKGES